MTGSDLAQFTRDLAADTREFVQKKFTGASEPLNARLDALERRVAELEAHPKGMEYQGTWSDGEVYQKNDCVTRQGAMWVCRVNDCQSIPGADEGIGWTMAVKRGRDGKNTR
jgi:hypothetical protein